jgi:hypothetical protein
LPRAIEDYTAAIAINPVYALAYNNTELFWPGGAADIGALRPGRLIRAGG